MTLILPLSSCGFRLRQPIEHPQDLKVLYWHSEIGKDRLQPLIKRWLQHQGLQLLPASAEGTVTGPRVVVSILEQQFEERSLVLNAQGQSVRAALSAVLRYKLSSGDRVEEKILRVVREFTQEPQAVLGMAQERKTIENQLLNTLAHQLLQQISHFVKPKPGSSS